MYTRSYMYPLPFSFPRFFPLLQHLYDVQLSYISLHNKCLRLTHSTSNTNQLGSRNKMSKESTDFSFFTLQRQNIIILSNSNSLFYYIKFYGQSLCTVTNPLLLWFKSLSVCLSFTLTHSLTHSHSHSLSLTHSHSLSLSLSLFLFLFQQY